MENIKRLLRLSETAQSKVEMNYDGTGIINPMQQASATRLYRKAYKMKENLSDVEFAQIHRDIMVEMNR